MVLAAVGKKLKDGIYTVLRGFSEVDELAL